MPSGQAVSIVGAGTGRRRRHTALPPTRVESWGRPGGATAVSTRTPNPGRLALHVRLPSGAALTLMQKRRVMKETATRRRRKKRRNHAVQSSQLLSPIIRTYSWGCTGAAALDPHCLPGAQRAPTMPHHACPGPYSRARGHLGLIWLKLTKIKNLAPQPCLLQVPSGPAEGVDPGLAALGEVGPGPMKRLSWAGNQARLISRLSTHNFKWPEKWDNWNSGHPHPHPLGSVIIQHLVILGPSMLSGGVYTCKHLLLNCVLVHS